MNPIYAFAQTTIADYEWYWNTTLQPNNSSYNRFVSRLQAILQRLGFKTIRLVCVRVSF